MAYKIKSQKEKVVVSSYYVFPAICYITIND